MQRKHEAIAGVALLLVVGAVGIGLSPPASAGHGTDANYTAQPADAPADRIPGASDASYKQFARGNESIRKVDYFVVTWEAGDLGGCGAGDTEELGIDRGANNSGTETDEGLLQYVKNQQRSEDRVVAEFYDDSDVAGGTTYINESDEIVTYQTSCFGNPDEPGWYQITSMVNGTGWDGEYKEVSVSSHYFWICDCESESEARDQLGPPPSEEDETGDNDDPTPTETDTGDGDATPRETSTTEDDTAPTETNTDGGGESTPGETTTSESDAGGQETGDRDDGGQTTTDAQASAANSTPTADDGSGFTSVGALLTLATTLLLFRRR
ncbi:MAG: hypothetical protein ACI8UR_001069 [Natronomonas sp.]|jgi:hypothetical protein